MTTPSLVDREAIRDAVITVADVANCSLYWRQTLGPGEAMIRLARTESDDSGFGYINTWEVWVGLGQDPVSSENLLDNIGPALLEAVEPVLARPSLTPSELVPMPGGPAVYGLIIQGARAAG